MFTKEKIGKCSLMSDRSTPPGAWVLSKLGMNKSIRVNAELITRVVASMTFKKNVFSNQ